MELPQLLACLDVEKRHGEEDNGEEQHHYILHFRSLEFRQNGVHPDSGQAALTARRYGAKIRSGKAGKPGSLLINDSGF
jgi:hypothetical protein